MNFMTSTLALALFTSGSALAAAPTTPTRTTLKLEASCKLVRRYLDPADPKGSPLQEDLTPASATPQAVTIVDATGGGGSVPMTEIRFTASTPDGDIEVTAFASAFEIFKTNLQLSLNQSVYLAHSKVGVTDMGGDMPTFKYTDKTIGQKSTILFSTGRTSQGFAVSQYFSECSLLAK